MKKNIGFFLLGLIFFQASNSKFKVNKKINITIGLLSFLATGIVLNLLNKKKLNTEKRKELIKTKKIDNSEIKKASDISNITNSNDNKKILRYGNMISLDRILIDESEPIVKYLKKKCGFFCPDLQMLMKNSNDMLSNKIDLSNMSEKSSYENKEKGGYFWGNLKTAFYLKWLKEVKDDNLNKGFIDFFASLRFGLGVIIDDDYNNDNYHFVDSIWFFSQCHNLDYFSMPFSILKKYDGVIHMPAHAVVLAIDKKKKKIYTINTFGNYFLDNNEFDKLKQIFSKIDILFKDYEWEKIGLNIQGTCECSYWSNIFAYAFSAEGLDGVKKLMYGLHTDQIKSNNDLSLKKIKSIFIPENIDIFKEFKKRDWYQAILYPFMVELKAIFNDRKFTDFFYKDEMIVLEDLIEENKTVYIQDPFFAVLEKKNYENFKNQIKSKKLDFINPSIFKDLIDFEIKRVGFISIEKFKNVIYFFYIYNNVNNIKYFINNYINNIEYYINNITGESNSKKRNEIDLNNMSLDDFEKIVNQYQMPV